MKHKRHHLDNTDNNSKGIHLFSGSTKLLELMINEPVVIKKKKPRNLSTSDKLIVQRASEAAVSPEWILNKDAVQGWAKTTKGKVMIVKRNSDGTFDIVHDEC